MKYFLLTSTRQTARQSLYGIVLTLLSACGSGDGARTVSIDAVTTYWAEAGTTSTVPVAIAAITLERPGDSRTYTAAPDATRMRWTVGDVPAGPYRLRVTYPSGPLLFVDVPTGASTLDLGNDRSGRAGSEVLLAATPVTLTLSGLQPWDPTNDYLELLGWNFGALTWPRLTASAGATGGAAAPFNWGRWAKAIPTDTVWVAQNRDGLVHAASGDTYSLVLAAQSVTGVSVTDGVALTIAADRMVQAAGTGSVRLNWKKSQYFALLDPSGSNPDSYALIKAQPAPLSVVASGIALMGLQPKSTADVDYGIMTYNRFMPATYREALTTTVETNLRRTLPGTATTFNSVMSLGRRDPLGAVPDPLVPLVGPVMGVTVNGMSAAQPISAVGLTPTIAWQAPMVGSATVYRVSIVEVSQSAGEVDMNTLAQWIQAGTSLTVPAGFLVSGKVYVFTISAESDSSGPGLAAPMRRGAGSRGTASFESNTIQP